MKLLVIICSVIIFINLSYADWQSTPIWTGGFTIGFGIGDGRNDTTNRVYATHISANAVKEFTYSGGWNNTSNISLPFYAERPLLVCDGRNDSTYRIYVGEFDGSGNAAEYTWNGSSWDYVNMGSAGQQLLNLVAGNARNDDTTRLYYSTGSSPPANVAWEYSYSGGWTNAAITAPSGYLMGNFGITIGNGKNDGINRIYLGLYPGYSFGELTWSGSNWTSEIVATGLSQVMGIVVGNGRNDGTNRVYVVCRYEGIREYTYSGASWNLTATIPLGGHTFDIDLGSGRNDGQNYLYISSYDGPLYEAAYSAGWSVSPIGTPGGNLFRVRIGEGRDDGKLRVYVAGSGGIFEYEWQDPGVSELPKSLANMILYSPTFFRDNIRLRFSKPVNEPLDITLYNAYGSVVYTKSLSNASSSVTLKSKEISDLKSGVYFLSVTSRENKLGGIKIIKP